MLMAVLFAFTSGNLPGVETNKIARGAVLASPQFVTRAKIDVRFRALPAALALLKRRTPVRAYLGSAEIIGTLVFTSLPTDAGNVVAKLFLRKKTVVFAGAAFIVRQLSPKTLLGGGTIAGVDGSGATAESDDDPAVVAASREAELGRDSGACRCERERAPRRRRNDSRATRQR